jgi:DnaJ-class molecular chaperone
MPEPADGAVTTEPCLICRGAGRRDDAGPCAYCAGSGRVAVHAPGGKAVWVSTGSCKVPAKRVQWTGEAKPNERKTA